MNNPDLMIIEELEGINTSLKKFLEGCNVEITTKTTYSLIKKLDEIVAIRKDKSYYGVETDDRGYIINLINIDGILERQELPVDITAGYYKYEKGNFILDEKMKLERR